MSDVHKHRCKKCGTVWQHDRELIPESELFDAHNCPKCGEHNSRRYYGDAFVEGSIVVAEESEVDCVA